jgi:hypothetical protein
MKRRLLRSLCGSIERNEQKKAKEKVLLFHTRRVCSKLLYSVYAFRKE